MESIIKNSFAEISVQAASDLFNIIQYKTNPLICVASGASPAGLYAELIRLVKSSDTDTSEWHFVGLDEWMGMNGDDEGSSRAQLNEQLFQPLNISEERIYFFNGRADDPEAECARIENAIASHDGIDVAILGIGVNAHIAMNEPGTSPHLRSHIADILPETQAIGQKYFREPRTIDKGITLGLATLLESKHIIVMASGTSKADSIKRMIFEPINLDCPAAWLREHLSISLYADAEAASLLSQL